MSTREPRAAHLGLPLVEQVAAELRQGDPLEGEVQLAALGEVGGRQVTEQPDEHRAATGQHLGEVVDHSRRQRVAVLVQLGGGLAQHRRGVLHVVNELGLDVPHRQELPFPRELG